MANWHQQQAMSRNPAPLWDETKWTVVEDGDCLCVSRFSTQPEAQGFLGNLRMQGKSKHAYILPPMQHQMPKGAVK